jgi:acyl carrier protein
MGRMNAEGILTDYIRRQFLRGRRSVAPDEDLLANGIIDSLGILQLVAFIEEQFGLRLPDEDVVLENFQSVAALSNYLRQAQSSGK